MENLSIVEEGTPEQLKANRLSKVGKEIEDININNYAFHKKLSKKSKSKSPLEFRWYWNCIIAEKYINNQNT